MRIPFLSTLKFTALENHRPSPLERRRAKLVEQLSDQLIRLDDPSYAKTRSKWLKDEQGKRLIERVIPVRPWWQETADGRLAFFVKSGLKKVEFKKGQTAIVVDNKAALPALIKGLIAAVQGGELDQFLTVEHERPLPSRSKAA